MIIAGALNFKMTDLHFVTVSEEVINIIEEKRQKMLEDLQKTLSLGSINNIHSTSGK